MAQFIGVRCQEVEVVDPDSMFKFIKMDPPQADLNYSIYNIQFLICGTFLVPISRGPQPMQGRFPFCPLAIHSNTFDSRIEIFAINVFLA
jgi:hypothetical protein